jgi:hypothetical protein
MAPLFFFYSTPLIFRHPSVFPNNLPSRENYPFTDAHREELLDCIRRVHHGQTFVSPEVAAKLASRLSEEELSMRFNGLENSFLHNSSFLRSY